eukprot:jgi/Undpi1/10510/HiC_scaffold_29.g12960.m1
MKLPLPIAIMTTVFKMVAALTFLVALTTSGVMGQHSCVQVNSTEFSSCPCADATLMFNQEGKTMLASNTVNLALVLDGSDSIEPSDYELEQQFAVDTVAAFAAPNLFNNGGMASYVQHSTTLVSSGTFDSAQDLKDFLDADVHAHGYTYTNLGIDEGAALLTALDATASCMIVIFGGKSTIASDTVTAAGNARAAGITLFALGVGSGTGDAELLAIAGDADNVFGVDDFDLLDATLGSILLSSAGTVIEYPSTSASVTIEFSVPIDSNASGSFNGSTVTFFASDLESTPTGFDVILDVCGQIPGDSIVVSATYTDNKGNDPDLSSVTGLVVRADFCAAPTTAPTTSPTWFPTVSPTPSTRVTRTPCPTMKDPKRGKGLKEGSAGNSMYLGCYKGGSRYNALDGHRSSSP